MKEKPGKLIDVLQMTNNGVGVASIAVAAAGTAYSECFPLPEGQPSIGIEYQLTSPGTTNVKLELQQSNVEPGTEGTADTNFVVPNDALELDDACADEVVHIKAYAPAFTRYARVKFTGLAGNDAGTVCSRLRVSYTK